MNAVEGTGEVKEYDSHSASSTLQVRQGLVSEEDDGILHTNVLLVSKLQGVQEGREQWRQVLENKPFKCLHDM